MIAAEVEKPDIISGREYSGTCVGLIQITYVHHNGEQKPQLNPSVLTRVCEHAVTTQKPLVVNDRTRSETLERFVKLGVPRKVVEGMIDLLKDQTLVSVIGFWQKEPFVAALSRSEDLEERTPIEDGETPFHLIYTRAI